MMRLLEVYLSFNPRLRGLRMASIDFNDWIETMRAVFSIESCRNLVSLGLNINVLYLEFTNQGYRSKFINTALGNLPSLERLDLS